MTDLYQAMVVRQRNELAAKLNREQKHNAVLAVLCAGLCIGLLCVLL